MKTELILDEMKKAIKRLEKDNKLKTIICIGAGLAVVIVGIVFLVVKMKDKNQDQLPYDYDDGWDAWDEDDYADYEDMTMIIAMMMQMLIMMTSILKMNNI